MKALACDAGRAAACPRSGPVERVWENREGSPSYPASAVAGFARASVCTDRSSDIVMSKRSLRRRRLKRRLLFGGLILALVLVYVAISVVRVGAAARDLMTRKARPAGLPR
jgi:predicted nucleic acid-binding Zn ribbon protein